MIRPAPGRGYRSESDFSVGQVPAGRSRTRFLGLTQEREFASTLERTLVSRTRMDTIEKGRQFRPARVQTHTRRGGLDRKAHLDVCCGELIARKPPLPGELGFHVSQ